MIFVTGDTHIPSYIGKLNSVNFPKQKNLSKKDYLIICGDFGGVCKNSDKEFIWLKWLEERPFTTLFIDGNHEDFDLLGKYDVQLWNGGKVHRINNSVIHFMRGQIYNIDGITIFTFGGAPSYYKDNIKFWSSEEIPSVEEQEEGIKNLEKYNWHVDFVFSHTCPMRILESYVKKKEMSLEFLDYSTEKYLNTIDSKLSFKHWFFGHYHTNMTIDSKYTVVFEDSLEVEDWSV